MNWEQFFADHKSVTTDSADEMRIEDLYQAFKARLIAELGVRWWDVSGPHTAAELFARAPTDQET